MRAIYQHINPYAVLGWADVNKLMPVKAEVNDKCIEVYDCFSCNPYFPIIPKCKHTKKTVNVGSEVAAYTEAERSRVYTFSEGVNHNQLTLTDPTEIRNMREYIRRRNDSDNPLITEVSFEGDEAELYPPTEPNIAPDNMSTTARVRATKNFGKAWEDITEQERNDTTRVRS